MTVMIPKSECKDRRLYRLDARNIAFGVYMADNGSFLGLRTKFGTTFVDEEEHWDNGPPYGTVKPLEELPEELPADIPNDLPGTALSELFAWLAVMEAKYGKSGE